jgi:CRP-like cAMP-binding protein/uncharacterized protein (DUF2249 family)
MALGFASDSKLDLRGVPIWEHAPHVCESFATLRDGHTLQVTCDYDPIPLVRRLRENFRDKLVYNQRRITDSRWEVLLRKAEPDDAADPMLLFINRCAVFQDCDERTRTALARAAVPRKVARNSIIVGQGLEWPFLAAVRQGRVVAVAESLEGREQILYEVLQYELFGAFTTIDGGATFARYATPSEPAEIVLFSRSDILTEMRNDVDFALALAEYTSQRTRGIIELVRGHVSKSTIARVAIELMRHAPIEYGMTEVDSESRSSLRLVRIAAAAGTVKEVAARALAALEEAGAIQRAHGRITHINRAKLHNFT